MERYQKMWRYMESNTPHTFVYSYEEGVERVLNGSYAFLGESTMLDYLVQRNCNLTQIGGLLVCFTEMSVGVINNQQGSSLIVSSLRKNMRQIHTINRYYEDPLKAPPTYS